VLSWELQDFAESGSLDMQPLADTFYAPSISIWVLHNKCSQDCFPSPKIPFEILCGCPFLLRNLPPTDPVPLADYLPYLNLLRKLLREHEDQILPYPIKISVKPKDLVLLKDLQPSPLGLWWTGPHLVILTTPSAVKLNGIPQWQHFSRNN
jgi:hypothetical protein